MSTTNFGPHPLTLFTQGTPNGFPISVALEELGLKYNVKPLEFSKNEQKQDWFLKICPNGRIPAIQDHQRGDFNAFETIAVLLYLARHYDPEHKISFDYEKEPDLWSQQMQWLAWAQGGLGPMQGQANHFVRYAPERIEYPTKRYVNESKRLYEVLDTHLQGRQWIVGDKYSLADIKAFPWVLAAAWANVSDLEYSEYPNIKAWIDRCQERPLTKKGLTVPSAFNVREKLANADAEAAKAREWVMAGNKQ